MLLGLLGGVGSALSQTASYHIARVAVSGQGLSPVQLLVVANIWMLIFAAVLAPFVWGIPANSQAILVGIAIIVYGYSVAQASFFWTVKQAAAGRIAPLLSVKIIGIACVAHFFLGQPLQPGQWGAVGLVVVATLAVQWAGERVPWRALCGVAITATHFVIADSGVALISQGIGWPPSMRLSIFVFVLCHIPIGCVSLLAIPCLRGADKRLLPSGAWYACAWTGAGFGLFYCIASLGLVIAIILQSLRGPMTIISGSILSHCGFKQFEGVHGKVLVRQLLAAALMVAAIAWFQLAAAAA